MQIFDFTLEVFHPEILGACHTAYLEERPDNEALRQIAETVHEASSGEMKIADMRFELTQTLKIEGA
jgi:hypothetical protein